MEEIDKFQEKRCEFQKPDGKRCRAWKIRGGKFCFNHADTTELIKRRIEARSKGGKARALNYADKMAFGIPLTSLRSAERILARLAHELQTGEIAPYRCKEMRAVVHEYLIAIQTNAIFRQFMKKAKNKLNLERLRERIDDGDNLGE